MTGGAAGYLLRSVACCSAAFRLDSICSVPLDIVAAKDFSRDAADVTKLAGKVCIPVGKSGVRVLPDGDVETRFQA